MASSSDVATKNDGANNDDLKKRETYKWTDESILALCRILNQYLVSNGRSSQFKWIEHQSELEKVTKTKVYNFRVLKNKYDEMRKDYSLWKSLKNGETGLGWDASTGKLKCSDQWWDKKIKENDKVKRIRKKQPSIELQEAWYQLFGDAIATGVEVVGPSVDASNFNDTYHVNAEDEDTGAGDDLNEDFQYPQDYTPVVNLEDQDDTFLTNFLNGVGGENVSEMNQTGGSKQPKKINKTSTKPVKMKRTMRESAGTSMFREFMSEQNATQKRALELLLDSDTKDQVGKTNIESVISVMNRMVGEKLIAEYDDLWCFGMTVLDDPVKR
ncbi:Myb/SANT-like domain-containing protein [Tanacetum coccineum]